FQAAGGIRDRNVTGVQTCALPIWRSDSVLYHDDLAVPNDPFYFRDFVANAARFGLKYLAESDLHSMSAAGVSADARAFLSTLDPDRKSTRLNSSHVSISYAVFCLK